MEKEENLGHEGSAWVSEYAWVYGNARVFDNAQVYGYAEVSDNAYVYGNARVYGNAQVSGITNVYGNARVSGNANVYGCTDSVIKKEEETMKLMNLLDCMSQYAYITLSDIYGITIFIGKVSDVPEKFWDKIVYLIIPEGDRNNISIY